jgi:hypothetical protein
MAKPDIFDARYGTIRIGDVLNSLFKFGKWLALLTCVVFLTSVLDNVPDCPELLNRNSAPSASIHLNAAIIPDSPSTSWISVLLLPLGDRPVIYERMLSPNSCVARLLPQAADPSPPLI